MLNSQILFHRILGFGATPHRKRQEARRGRPARGTRRSNNARRGGRQDITVQQSYLIYVTIFLSLVRTRIHCVVSASLVLGSTRATPCSTDPLSSTTFGVCAWRRRTPAKSLRRAETSLRSAASSGSSQRFSPTSSTSMPANRINWKLPVKWTTRTASHTHRAHRSVLPSDARSSTCRAVIVVSLWARWRSWCP